ncbi:hypothetical protein [Bacillus bombysepticus]|uniref:hypothetical protein n=1 Tax=Bacillus bombysepticus TaxID=658666 RepID=UPI0030196CEF
MTNLLTAQVTYITSGFQVRVINKDGGELENLFKGGLGSIVEVENYITALNSDYEIPTELKIGIEHDWDKTQEKGIQVKRCENCGATYTENSWDWRYKYYSPCNIQSKKFFVVKVYELFNKELKYETSSHLYTLSEKVAIQKSIDKEIELKYGIIDEFGISQSILFDSQQEAVIKFKEMYPKISFNYCITGQAINDFQAEKYVLDAVVNPLRSHHDVSNSIVLLAAQSLIATGRIKAENVSISHHDSVYPLKDNGEYMMKEPVVDVQHILLAKIRNS